MEQPTDQDRLNLCDIVWWMKGYRAGAKDQFEQCPFEHCHIESLEKVIKGIMREKELVKPNSNKD